MAEIVILTGDGLTAADDPEPMVLRDETAEKLATLVHHLMGHVGYVGPLREIYDQHDGDELTRLASRSVGSVADQESDG